MCLAVRAPLFITSEYTPCDSPLKHADACCAILLMPTNLPSTENSDALAASPCVVMVKTPLACDMLASVTVFSSMADALPNVIVTCCVNSASVSTFVAVMFTEANLLELSAPYCLAKTSFVTNLSPSTENAGSDTFCVTGFFTPEAVKENSQSSLSVSAVSVATTAAALLGQTDRIPTAAVSDDDIKFALFGGDGEITDAMYQEVKDFAALVKLREEMRRTKE